MKTENQNLHAKFINAELKFVSKTKLCTGTIQPTTASQAEETEANICLWKEVKAIARHFGLFITLFFDPDLLLLTHPDFASNDPICYSTLKNQTLGKVAELYELVPEKYHHLMSVAQIMMSNALSFISAVSLFY